jgi:hypothetical protein
MVAGQFSTKFSLENMKDYHTTFLIFQDILAISLKNSKTGNNINVKS